MRSSVLLALTLASLSAVGCVRETVSCEGNPSSVCPELTDAAVDAPRFDANADAPGLDAFEPPRPDVGFDGTIPDANCGCTDGEVCVSGGTCGCLTDANCTQDTAPICNTETNQCVACLSSTDCGAPTPFCDTTDNTCVGCVGEADCTGNLDACVTNACVACDDRADCVDDVGLPACVGNACRQCDVNTDCGSSATPRCDLASSTCAACTADADCTRFGATPVCDEGRGVCVQCTGDTESTQCGMNSCRRSDGTCTDQRVGQLDSCDSCEADSECVAGQRCVRHVFSGTDTGTFCFADAALVGGCVSAPFSQPVPLTSIDGTAATFCLPPVATTCRGIRDTRSVVCALDTQCGVSALSDGYCPLAGTAIGFCSYRCSGAVDCASGNCGGSPQHCRP